MRKRRSIIKQLQQKFPEEDFVAVKDGFSYRYVGKTRSVGIYIQLSPKYDGDDESSISVYIDDKGRQVGSCGIIY